MERTDRNTALEALCRRWSVPSRRDGKGPSVAILEMCRDPCVGGARRRGRRAGRRSIETTERFAYSSHGRRPWVGRSSGSRFTQQLERDRSKVLIDELVAEKLS